MVHQYLYLCILEICVSIYCIPLTSIWRSSRPQYEYIQNWIDHLPPTMTLKPDHHPTFANSTNGAFTHTELWQVILHPLNQSIRIVSLAPLTGRPLKDVSASSVYPKLYPGPVFQEANLIMSLPCFKTFMVPSTTAVAPNSWFTNPTENLMNISWTLSTRKCTMPRISHTRNPWYPSTDLGSGALILKLKPHFISSHKHLVCLRLIHLLF